MSAGPLAFAAGALGALGIGMLAAPAAIALARGGRSARAGKAPLVVRMARLARVLGGGRDRSVPRELAAQIRAAGLDGDGRGRLDPGSLMGLKAGSALAGGAAALIVGPLLPGRLGLLLLAGLPAALFFAPDLVLARRAAARAEQVRTQLPAVLDLLRVSVQAGLGLRAALAEVSQRSAGLLASELRSVAAATELGVPLSSALTGLSGRLPQPEVTAFVAALNRALIHGAPLAATLAAQARDARAARARKIRERSARAAPKIQLVVALMLVPSVLLIIAAALVVALADGGGLPLL